MRCPSCKHEQDAHVLHCNATVHSYANRSSMNGAELVLTHTYPCPCSMTSIDIEEQSVDGNPVAQKI